MMQNTLELIFNSSFTFSIPAWIVFISVTFACWLLYWDKHLSRLRMNGKPTFFNVTHNSFEVRWNRPTFAFPSRYNVYVRKAAEPDAWQYFTTSGGECSLTITDLALNTEFVVTVCACEGTETGPIGNESDVITTRNLAFKIKSESTLLQLNPAVPNCLPMHAVAYEVEENDVRKIRRIKIGKSLEDGLNQNGKSILMMSTPHSGRTTLLQGMMNFIFGVSSNDDFRLCFAPEILNMTDLYQDWVTVFEFQEYEGGKLDYPLTIIDIPRIRGSKQKHFQSVHDKLNFSMNLYQKKIDLICFVAQANTFSLPSDQIEYIQTIKYLFETDSEATCNMCCIFTFADLGPVHVKKALEENEITFNESFSVNWSNVFKKLEISSDLFWKSNYNELRKCFDQLRVSVCRSLRINKNDAPEKRKQLMANISLVQPEVNKDIAELGEIMSHVKTFTVNKQEIMSTGDFSFTIEEITQSKQTLEPGHHVTNCMQCYFTCHEDCSYEDNDDKVHCIAMRDGYCQECTGHCIWSVHKNTPYIYIYDSVEVTKSYKDMKLTYEIEKGETLNFDAYLENLNKDIEALLGRLYDKVQRITEYDNELKGIEKSPLAGSFDDTIDNIIESEKLKTEKGYERRIEMFLELKKYAKMIRVFPGGSYSA